MSKKERFIKDRQYIKFCLYGFLKNLRFFDAFFILFLVGKGISFTQIGLLYAVREVITNLFEIPSGIIADTFGRKRALAGSFILYIGSFVLFYLFQDFWFFLIAFILFGLAEAFRSGTHKGMIMDYLKIIHMEKHSADYYGHTRSWSQKGSAISALIAGIIVLSGGSYQSVFLYSAAPYVLNFLLILSYPAALNRSLEPTITQRSNRLGNATRMLLKLLKKPQVLKIIYSSAAHTAYLRSVKDYIQLVMFNLAVTIPILVHRNVEQKSGLLIGALYFLIYLATSTASKYSWFLAQRSRFNMAFLTLMAGFLAGAVSGMAFKKEFWILSLLFFTGIYIMENIRKPLLTGAIADEVPREILTSVISAQSLLRTILTTILALVLGWAADHFGVGISLFAISTLLLLSGLLAQNKVRS
ncbi:MAG: MFS transporter [Bacteroidales bacterium]|nr:MFS transporter [Bacteroidales bacterium]